MVLNMNWIVPKVYGKVCDIGSGIGYPTESYFIDVEVVTLSHELYVWKARK